MGTLAYEIFARLSQTAIIPYYMLLGVYILMYSPHLGSVPEEMSVAFLKILPIYYLVLYVHQNRKSRMKKRMELKNQNGSNTNSHAGTPSPTRKDGQNGLVPKENKFHDKDEDYYGLYFCRGLIISSVGDICMVYDRWFQEGILAFGVAQIFYLLALRRRHERSRLAWLVIPLNVILYATIYADVQDTTFRVLTLFYSVLLHAMLFYAVASWESRPSPETWCSAVGAAHFIVSDFLIAYNTWCSPTPFARAIITWTYYVAQLLLVLGIS